MHSVRIIPRLDIKGANLIKGIHLEGLRVIGSPKEYALNYYQQGADELIYMDSVASLYGRNSLDDIIRSTVDCIFIPITVGGGIRSVDDVTRMLRCGADKVAINTAGVANPNLLNQVAHRFGSQCLVVSIEAKQVGENSWEVYTENGRERTGLNAVEWAKQAVELGAGEILVTSIDREGTRRGFDLDLLRAIVDEVSVPVIASGGMGKHADLARAVNDGRVNAVAIADMLHYKRTSVRDIREFALSSGIKVRRYD